MKKTKRRGHGEGTIYQRENGLWAAQFTMPDGSRRSVSGKRQQDVRDKLNELKREAEKFQSLKNQGQTVGEFVDGWIEMIEHTIRPRTYHTYQSYMRNHIEPLRDIPIARLTVKQVQDLYTAKLKSGLSSTTVRHLHAILHKALEKAVRLEVVTKNVCDDVDPPRMAEHTYVTLSPEQAQAFMNSAKGTRWEALYIMAITTGMREGELFAQKWKNLDWERGTIQVLETLHFYDSDVHFAKPKTKKSIRTVYLSRFTLNALKRHQELQEKEKEHLGDAWDDSYDLIFPNTIGRPMHFSDFIVRTFKADLKKANVPDMRFHDLRHTAATLLLMAGVNPKVVCEMLGHSSITITLQLYSHVTPIMHMQAADEMDNYFLNDRTNE